MKDEIIIHTDGGSRGNPGPAAAAFIVEQNEIIIYQESKFLGNATNNIAEYNGVVIALEWIIREQSIHNTQSSIIFYLDSELVVKQINGLYKVKDNNLKVLHNLILDLLKKVSVNVIFKNVLREKNKLADSIVNQELDKHFVRVSRP